MQGEGLEEGRRLSVAPARGPQRRPHPRTPRRVVGRLTPPGPPLLCSWSGGWSTAAAFGPSGPDTKEQIRSRSCAGIDKHSYRPELLRSHTTRVPRQCCPYHAQGTLDFLISSASCCEPPAPHKPDWQSRRHRGLQRPEDPSRPPGESLQWPWLSVRFAVTVSSPVTALGEF